VISSKRTVGRGEAAANTRPQCVQSARLDVRPGLQIIKSTLPQAINSGVYVLTKRKILLRE
jgi:hypothetical protein